MWADLLAASLEGSKVSVWGNKLVAQTVDCLA